MDCSLPGSSVHGIFKARVPEWGAIAFSVKREQSAHIWCDISSNRASLVDQLVKNLPAMQEIPV